MSDEKENEMPATEETKEEPTAGKAWALGLLGAMYDTRVVDKLAERQKEQDRREDLDHEARMAFYARNAEMCELDKARFARDDERYLDYLVYRDECRQHMYRQTAALEAIAAAMAKEDHR